MICLRCGYCCTNYFVPIVDNPDKGLAEGNLKIHKGDGTPCCQHLRGEGPGSYSCAVHDRPWYPETPCHSHGQIERGNTNCRIGEYSLSKRKPSKIKTIATRI